MSNIADHLQIIKNDIAQAALEAQRNENDITLVAVSKRQPIQAIMDAYEAGQRHFGENYAQELRDKAAQLSHLTDIQWHYIGNLQRNKVKYVVPTVSVMECIDTIKIAEEFSKKALAQNRTIDVFLQVNVGDEAQKSGCAHQEAAAIADGIKQLPHIRLTGLMTIPPFNLNATQTRVYFRKLHELREQLGGAEVLPHLSMGMSRDFKEAILEGATMVRVGTAIFGDRPPKQW